MHQRSSQFYLKALAALLMTVILTSCGKPIDTSSSEEIKNPLHRAPSFSVIFDESMTKNFGQLPLKGEVKKGSRFWSGDSWRHTRGSINLRWNATPQIGFNYLSPASWEAVTFPTEKMRQLSPAEKYDLYMGRYDYPLRWEVDTFARNAFAEWEGICHGWAGASINHDEPKPKTVINPDGIEIQFGSSDIKALISYAYSKILIGEKDSLGKRCEENTFIEETCDEDLSPENFHVVLGNKLGIRGQSVIADLDRYKEVWNHPLIKYESTIEKTVIHKDMRTHIISTQITYTDVVEKNSWNTHPPVTGLMTFRYSLELDVNGNILKGSWISNERPDFLWTIDRAEKFEGYLSGVFDLLKK